MEGTNLHFGSDIFSQIEIEVEHSPNTELSYHSEPSKSKSAFIPEPPLLSYLLSIIHDIPQSKTNLQQIDMKSNIRKMYAHLFEPNLPPTHEYMNS